MLNERARHDLHITCAVCATHRRPRDAAYEQHTPDCPRRIQMVASRRHRTRG